jgi:hypothetical protein
VNSIKLSLKENPMSQPNLVSQNNVAPPPSETIAENLATFAPNNPALTDSLPANLSTDLPKFNYQVMPRVASVDRTPVASLPPVTNVIIIFAGLWSGVLAALSVCYLSAATPLEIIAMLMGQILAGLTIGLWCSRISGERSSTPWRLRLMLLNMGLPFLVFLVGSSWGAGLFYWLAPDVPITTLFWAPILIMQQYFWLPLAFLPLMLVAARAQVRRYGQPLAALVSEPIDLGTFAVRRRLQTAVRCDTCHQDDRFDPKISFCRRCQRYSL